MVVTETLHDWIAPDGASLSGRIWEGSHVDSVVLLVHGFSEHGGRYSHLGQFFARHGIATVAFDHRGHGLSSGKRGHIRSYKTLIDDVAGLIEITRGRFDGASVFVYGHSMGGGVVANLGIRGINEGVSGLILSAPWLQLSFQPPRWKVSVGRVASRIMPSLTLSAGKNERQLCRDEDMLLSYQSDPLVHNRISPALYFGAVAAGRWAAANAADCRLPVLAMHGTADLVTSHGATQRFAELAPNAEFHNYSGWYHELHNEPDRDDLLRSVVHWIRERSRRQSCLSFAPMSPPISGAASGVDMSGWAM